MKTILNIVLIFLLLTGNVVLAQDSPRSCANSVSSFDEIIKGKITSQIKTAHNYFMNSIDSAAGNSYEQRTANFNIAVKKTFQEFMKVRREEYQKTICSYYKEDWNSTQSSSSSWRTITCQTGFILISSSIKTTGPIIDGPLFTSTTVKWKTGRPKTSVDIQAKYDENYIVKIIIVELNKAQIDLNATGIPTEVPPFLD